MIRFIRDPQNPTYAAYRSGMVRDLGDALNAQLIASGDAVDFVEEGRLYPPAFVRVPPGKDRINPVDQGDSVVAVAAEAYGVSYSASAAFNVARMNLALSENRVVTLSTPGQYLFGGPGQGGILARSGNAILSSDGVELILADGTYTPLIRNVSAFADGLPLGAAVTWFGGAPFWSARINYPGIHLVYPLGARFALLGLPGTNASNRNYQGVWKVTAVAADQVTFSLAGQPPSGGNSAATGVVYPVDSGIRIIGGLWDGNETGQAGNGYSDGDPRSLIMTFRNAQNVVVKGAKFRKGAAWCIGTNNIRDATFCDLEGDLSGPIISAHDVVHIAGGARNVLITRITADCDDNIVGVTADVMGAPGNTTYPNYDPGDTYDITIRDIHGRHVQAAAVALWGNTNYVHHSTVIERITGQGGSGAVHVTAPYAPTNMLNCNGGSLTIRDISGSWFSSPVLIQSEGSWDNIEIDGVRNEATGTAPPAVLLQRASTTQTIKRLSIRGLDWNTPGSSGNREGPMVRIENSNVDDLSVEGMSGVRLAANVSAVVFSGSAGTVSRAVVSNVSAIGGAAGDCFVVSCENTNAAALGLLTVRDCAFTGAASTGGVVRQATAGRVTRIRSDNSTTVTSENASGIVRDNVTGGQTAALDIVSVATT